MATFGTSLPITVAIPTFHREAVLLNTVRRLLGQQLPAAEILVIDQTSDHEMATEKQLKSWQAEGRIRWVRLSEPSQPGALNQAVRMATQPLILFLDDDIEIEDGFVEAHASSFENPDVWAVVGQVLQPGEEGWTGFVHVPQQGPLADLEFPFRSADPTSVANGMSGNLSVRRQRALELGGFDENFLPPVSYRFDTDFCKRLLRAGGTIRFQPAASIHHLRADRGGTRSQGNHMTSASPIHGVGDYYFALRQGLSLTMMFYILKRPVREVRTRFHLRHPWWIPVKLIGELRALLLALRLYRKGPRLIPALSK